MFPEPWRISGCLAFTVSPRNGEEEEEAEAASAAQIFFFFSLPRLVLISPIGWFFILLAMLVRFPIVV